MMVGHSSNKISKGGVRYNYYKCKNAGAGKPCKKKMAMKDYLENLIIEECRRILSPSNIRRIAKETVKLAQSYDDQAELKRLSGLLQKAQEEKENQMTALRSCKSDSVREMIFADLEKIGADIAALEKNIRIEQGRHHIISEEQIVKFFNKLAKGDVKDLAYRKTLIRVMVNRIFLYDDRLTLTFNSGDDEVTITDKLLSEIEEDLRNKTFCLINQTAHQLHLKANAGNRLDYRCLFFFHVFL